MIITHISDIFPDAVSIQYILSPHNALCHKHIATSMQKKSPKRKKITS